MNSKTSDQNSEEQAGTAAVGGAHLSLGEQLRRAREERGINLRELSDQTRIARRYLEAIETDTYKELPGGIFNRSFIKAYAKAVGFSEAEAIRAYTAVAREHGEEPDDLPTSRQHSRIYMDGDTSRSPLINALLSLVILTIISLGVYAGLHYYQRRTAPPTAAAPSTAAASNPQTPPAPQTTSPAAPPPTTTGALNVRIKAKGEEVWVRTRVDEQPKSEGNIAADGVREVTLAPAESLLVQYSKSRAKSLEITINGRPAVVPAEAKGKSYVELVITKDGYEQLLQQP